MLTQIMLCVHVSSGTLMAVNVYCSLASETLLRVRELLSLPETGM